jgi:nicotinate-nucleotide adenylyltransferase
MVELAIADDERFTTSRIEIDREGPSYTADTLEQLLAQSPEDELFLILGGDQAAALPTWHEPEKVLERATVAVLERLSWGRNAIGIKIGRMKGVERVRYLDMPLMQVSSSMVRRRVRKGLPIRYLVPDKVVEYIAANELYGGQGSRKAALAT